MPLICGRRADMILVSRFQSSQEVAAWEPTIVEIRTLRHSGFIESADDIRRGIASLRRRCKVMRRIHDAIGDPPLRRTSAGFEGLARVVVAQQLSAQSAAAIWARLSAALAPMSPAAVSAAPDETLRGLGLSGGKVRTLRNLVAAIGSGALDLDGIDAASTDELHAALTAVSGIGPWTADIYMMFCLGRADSFAVGDLALQLAVQHAFALDARPTPAELAELSKRWQPWRGVAARLLWAYYPTIRGGREGTPPT